MKGDFGGHVDLDKQPYYIRIWFPPVFGPKHENVGAMFVQLDPDEVNEFYRHLRGLKRDKRILKFTGQLIPKFWTLKHFMKSLPRRSSKRK